MGRSKIEWTRNEDGSMGQTVNPIRARNKETGNVGHFCEKISPGCGKCYAADWNIRGRGACGTGLDFIPQNRDKVEIFLDENQLRKVLGMRTGTKIFWENMSDLFGEWVEDDWLHQCFATMALTPQHVHQVLTKRPERMMAFFQDQWTDAMIEGNAQRIYAQRNKGEDPSMWLAVHCPIPNVWLGVSVENQEQADKRIPLLLQTPAAVRFLSVEPLLGQVRLDRLNDGKNGWIDCLGGVWGHGLSSDHTGDGTEEIPNGSTGDGIINWVIIGGESGGNNARPCDPEWIRSIVRECQTAGVAPFVKQLGTAWAMRQENWRKSGSHYPDRKGGDPNFWPEDLRVREFPQMGFGTEVVNRDG